MELITTYIAKGKNIGIHDNMFGGDIMSLVDDASAAYAMQICDNPRVVTLKVSELVFRKPIKVGNLIKIYGEVKAFGNTSLTLNIEVRKHNVYTGIQEVVLDTTIVFVRIDEEGNSVPLGDRIKTRYTTRMEKYGRGLLSIEEIEKEKAEKK